MYFQLMRSGAAALAVSLALAAGAAVAQTQPAKPPAPAPAAPGAPAQPQQPPPPSKVDLVSPEPQWAKFCAKEPNSGRDACATMRDFSTSADQPPMISLNLFELAGEEKRKLRFLMLPIGMMLKPGFRVVIDKGEPIEGRYDMCFQNACSAEIEVSPKMLEALKKGQTMSVVMRVPGGDASGHELTFNIPLKDLVFGVRRQADRSEGAGAAAPGVAAAAAKEGGRAAQDDRTTATEQRRRPGRERGSRGPSRARRSSARRSGEVSGFIMPPAHAGGVARGSAQP